jgi:hypothetical protein
MGHYTGSVANILDMDTILLNMKYATVHPAMIFLTAGGSRRSSCVSAEDAAEVTAYTSLHPQFAECSSCLTRKQLQRRFSSLCFKNSFKFDESRADSGAKSGLDEWQA